MVDQITRVCDLLDGIRQRSRKGKEEKDKKKPSPGTGERFDVDGEDDAMVVDKGRGCACMRAPQSVAADQHGRSRCRLSSPLLKEELRLD